MMKQTISANCPDPDNLQTVQIQIIRNMKWKHLTNTWTCDVTSFPGSYHPYFFFLIFTDFYRQRDSLISKCDKNLYKKKVVILYILAVSINFIKLRIFGYLGQPFEPLFGLIMAVSSAFSDSGTRISKENVLQLLLFCSNSKQYYRKYLKYEKN